MKAAIRFYYFLAPNNEKDPVVQFPDGLRILSGNPNSKSANPNNYAMVCQALPNTGRSDVTAYDFNFATDCPRVSERQGRPLLLSDIKHVSCSRLVGFEDQPLHA